MTEFETKQNRILELIETQGLDALLLRRVSSFAWATCGAASFINTAVTNGEAALLVTRSRRYLITNNIEATRMEKEEKLKEQGWEFIVRPWYSAGDLLANTGVSALGTDGDYPCGVDLALEVARLRVSLTPEGRQRFRELGCLCAAAMNQVCRQVRPGMSEYEIAALLAHEALNRGVQPIVNLIATDERIYAHRHPLPTGKKLERYAMLVLCGRKNGLVCSITRFVHFGRLPSDLKRKAEAVATVDAAFISATRPGKTLGEIFDAGVAAYTQAGFSGEWQLHHQGGPAGYEPREFVATPGSPEVVVPGEAFAWNPSITGAKVEDTILVGEQGFEVLTSVDDWPIQTVHLDGKEFHRPKILEIT
ncbi:MAG: aminopeptidase P family protein [Chloroflexota bacterium]|nr:MAG: aminopeptidase P family protein [Chloroflexota bacterium]